MYIVNLYCLHESHMKDLLIKKNMKKEETCQSIQSLGKITSRSLAMHGL